MRKPITPRLVRVPARRPPMSDIAASPRFRMVRPVKPAKWARRFPAAAPPAAATCWLARAPAAPVAATAPTPAVAAPTAAVAAARLIGLLIRQHDFRRAAFHQHIEDAGAHRIGEALRCHQHRTIRLAQRLQPFADFLTENRMTEHDPGFIERQKGRLPFQRPLEAAEQIEQSPRCRCR